MCGILGILGRDLRNIDAQHQTDGKTNLNKILREFAKGVGRGPEKSSYRIFDDVDLFMGFHRLAINGVRDDLAMQPMTLKNCVLIANGEIYNHQELYSMTKNEAISKSDCEIIIHMYRQFGIEYTLQILDGVFAFLLYDQESGEVFVARDNLWSSTPVCDGMRRWIGAVFVGNEDDL